MLLRCPKKTPVPLFVAILCAWFLPRCVDAQDDVAPPPANAREVFARYDIGPAQFSRFVDGGPISSGEEEVLVKILLRFSRLGLENIHRWRKTDVNWNAIAAATHQRQGELFVIRGRAKLVTEHPLPPELAGRLEFAHYYAVNLAIEHSPHEALVLTRTVPKAWSIGTPFDEPAVVDGLLLKLGAPSEGRQQFVFAAGRVSWLPDSSRLARAGFDVSLFDQVHQSNGQGLLGDDREPFYQLLAAISRVERTERDPTSTPLDVVPLLEQPEAHHGEFLPVRGTARRIVKVAISDAGVRERLGLDHYYEIDLFVPLGAAKLRFGEANKIDESPVFENTFPVTLIARQLPPGLAEGELLHEQVAADAVFFKLWTYQSPYMARFNRVQPAPLLMTHEPRLVPVVEQENWVSSGLITATLAGVLLVGAVALWWYRRGDEAYREQRRRQLRSGEQARPDFRGL